MQYDVEMVPTMSDVSRVDQVQWLWLVRITDGRAVRVDTDAQLAIDYAHIEMMRELGHTPYIMSSRTQTPYLLGAQLTDEIRRGHDLICAGKSYSTTLQTDGLAIGACMEAHRRLHRLTGQCAAGCSADHITCVARPMQLTDGGTVLVTKQHCRWAGVPCGSCSRLETPERLEQIERLVTVARELVDGIRIGRTTAGDAVPHIESIIRRIDGHDNSATGE